MKIAFVTESWWPRINGVTVSIDTFREEFERRGHEVFVIASDYGMTPEEIRARDGKGAYRVRGVTPVMSPEDSIIDPFESRRVKRILDDIKPDVIHIHTEYFAAAIGLMWARKRKVPSVMSFHTYYEEYAQYYFSKRVLWFFIWFVKVFDRIMFNRPTAVVTPSAFMADVLRRYGIKKPIHVIPTGLDPAQFRLVPGETPVPPLSEADTGALRGKRVLLFVGRVGREKNLDFLIEVFRRVLATNPDVALVMGGGGPYLDSLRETVASDPELRSRVFLPGFLDRSRMKYLYRMAEVFVFPSRTETQGLVTIEAMMSGVPVVAVGERGTVSVMQGDNGGFMVPCDVETFAARVRELLDDPILRLGKSVEAIAWAEKWTISSTADDMLALYERLIAENATDSRDDPREGS